MFDLQADPLEQVNLADHPDTKTVTSDLTALMLQWQETLGDDQALRSENPKPKQVDYSNFKQRRDRWQPDWIYEKYFR